MTHGGRGSTEDPNHILGHSYPFLIASAAAADHPEQAWRFVNRGVSGDSVHDLLDRWDEDALVLRPDVLSILIGTNDADAALAANPIDADGSAFAAAYRLLLERTRTALPAARLVLSEPFYLPTSPDPDLRAAWAAAVMLRAQLVRELAGEFGTGFVANQAAFDAAVLRAPAEHWIWDGIHPTYAGQRILADAWLTAICR
ncbi:SGNH/GDSL hydrolase family protein [Kribbella sp. CA-293567]|uniref:SGNH/GDSL hydrolase family protein n=1 Tax=Kribbella sp. CA-293567 TaxID=3002436 RepID=UPI0022DDEC6B|nr:SGNH/GDSL hydrolase family protein [Kribbella sp. CA-293567]WBQ08685.1 SGNH/GDSL hydrolase family protein [Kribbella sp. CA-293567]